MCQVFKQHWDNHLFVAFGRRTSVSLPNGVTTTYSYDNANHLLTLQHLGPTSQVLESLTYTYDPTGNRTKMNRQSVNLPLRDPVTSATYNDANHMLTFTPSSGTVKNMTYDDNGNLASMINGCGTTTYAWDVRNRLGGMTGFNPDCSPVSATFKYDALGRRVEKTVNGRTIRYLYDGLDIIQEIDNGLPSVNYIRTMSIDEPLARIEANGTVRYYQTDALGSVISLTDQTGAVKTQFTYDPFGNVTITGEQSDNPFQYTGRENDGTGLFYYRARYHSPELQRFISEDPIKLLGDINFFTYVGNNPINLVDPDGLVPSVPGALARFYYKYLRGTFQVGDRILCRHVKMCAMHFDQEDEEICKEAGGTNCSNPDIGKMISYCKRIGLW